MKSKILTLLLLVSLPVFSGQIPKGLFGTEGTNNVVDETQLNQIEEQIGDLLDINHDVSEYVTQKNEEKSFFGWKPFGFVTTLAVNSGGKLGIVGLGGLAAVEVYWRKKANNQKSFESNESDYQEASAYEGHLTSVDADQAIEAQVQSAMGTLKALGKIENLGRAEKEMREHLKSFVAAAKDIEKAPRNFGAWYLDALRIDLSVSVTGTVTTTPAFTVGGGVLVRIFWHRVRPTGEVVANNNSSDNKLSTFVADMAELVESLPEDKEIKKSGLGLKAIRIGVGMSAAGNVVIGAGSGAVVFNIFLAKNPKYQRPVDGKASTLNESASFLVADKDVVAPVPMDKMRKGMLKAIKLARPFLKKANKKNSKFEPFMLWNIYSFSASGGVGLATLGGIAQLQLIFKK